jgi:nucleoside-diphosphate-sugar epimerase/choline dehydrogenase-like flavoprotein
VVPLVAIRGPVDPRIRQQLGIGVGHLQTGVPHELDLEVGFLTTSAAECTQRRARRIRKTPPMILEDLRVLNTDSPIDTDVCIVGSGPAGWTIAEELGNSSLRILMLESGGVDWEGASDSLNEIESVGAPLMNGRDRMLGGTSSVWHGRCIPLKDLDYEAREWVPGSGWPFGSETVAPYLNRASEYLGAGACQPESPRFVPRDASKRPKVDPALLDEVCWEDTPPVQFGLRVLASKDANLRVLLHATVTHLNTDATGARLESVEIASAPDRRTTVRARAVVLCAGGVENARIMLYSNRVQERGVGNAHDVVGRYFMDHPRDVGLLARFDLRDAARARSLFGPYRLGGDRQRHEVAYGFALSSERQRREGFLNCSAMAYEAPAADDPLLAAKRLSRGPRTQARLDTKHLLSQPGIVARGLGARLTNQRAMHKLDRVGFLVSSEQVPDRESRISLSERRDRLGLPISRIDWRIAPDEKASQAALAKTIASEFQRLGLPAVKLADWVRNEDHEDAALIDSCHPIGATRMAADPHYGVVDPNCGVHGVEGLHVAGSSVFPTGGYANPTLMIVALAVRLADHLREQLSASTRLELVGQTENREEFPAAEAQGPTVPPGARVAVTGATGFIGRRLVERLVDQEADVTCLVRRSPSHSHPLPAGATVRTLELTDAETLREALDGTDLVFHCAYDWDDESWNPPALRALIDACRGCGRLVHLSSFVVYEPSGDGEVTEDSPETRAEGGYAHTKLGLEAELMRAVREDGLPAAILQPTIVYGPHSRPWTDAPADMLRFGTVVLSDAGQGICNAVYVDDVVRAMVLAATDDRAVGERFLISGPRPISWAQFYAEIAKAVGAEGPKYQPSKSGVRRKIRKLFRFAADPTPVMGRLGRTRWGEILLRALPEEIRARVLISHTRRPGHVHEPDVHSSVTVSSAKARRVIGYEPQFDFDKGMVLTSKYLREYVRQDPTA